MMRVGALTVLLLTLAVTASAIAVVQVKYRTRIHFGELQNLRAQRDAIDVEWNRLRLEEAALSTHARLERKAREDLGMFDPAIGDVMLIEETAHALP